MTDKITIFDAATGEITERPATADELAAIESARLEAELFESEQEAKVSARESALAKLAKLGLTQAEIDAL